MARRRKFCLLLLLRQWAIMKRWRRVSVAYIISIAVKKANDEGHEKKFRAEVPLPR